VRDAECIGNDGVLVSQQKSTKEESEGGKGVANLEIGGTVE